MYTVFEEIRAEIQQLLDRDRRGLSGDPKPVAPIELSSTFYEADTGAIYEWTGSAWVLRIANVWAQYAVL